MFINLTKARKFNLVMKCRKSRLEFLRTSVTAVPIILDPPTLKSWTFFEASPDHFRLTWWSGTTARTLPVANLSPYKEIPGTWGRKKKSLVRKGGGSRFIGTAVNVVWSYLFSSDTLEKLHEVVNHTICINLLQTLFFDTFSSKNPTFKQEFVCSSDIRYQDHHDAETGISYDPA